jgi:diguanylate cyclase (GGDEF)-like protein/putative nucleotidyltransferase with HDIG domain
VRVEGREGEIRLNAALASALRRHRTADELYDATCAVLHSHLGPDALASVYVLEDGRIWLRAQRGYAHVIHSLPLGSGLMTHALETRTTVHVGRDVANDPRFIPPSEGLAAEIAVPFEAESIAGVVNLESHGPLADALVPVVEDVAAELGQALARLPESERDPEAGTRWLTRAFLRAGALREPAALLELAARTIGEILELECVQVAQLEDDGLAVAATWNRAPGRSAELDAETFAVVAADLELDASLYQPGQGVARPSLEALGRAGRGAVVGLPLRSAWGLLGYAIGTAPEISLSAALRFAEAELFATHVATALDNLRAYERKSHEAATDGLTGLGNHRAFHERAAELVGDSRPAGFALVLADLDDFKELNDAHGHVAGDDALRALGGLLARSIRPSDTAFRLGGEEFALLLPGASREEALAVCDRLQAALAATRFGDAVLSLSFGLALFPDHGPELREMVAAADAALYEAKRLGKDRAVVANERLAGRRSPSMVVRTRRSFEQMRHLQGLTRRLVAARNAQGVASELVAELGETIPFAAACVYVIDGPGLGSVLARNGDAGHDAHLEKAARTVVDLDESLLVPRRGEGNGRAPRALMATPLRGERAVEGAIALAATTSEAFDNDDLRVLEVVAHIAGLALENARLYESAVRDRARVGELLDLGRRLAGYDTLEAVAAAVAETAAARLECDRVSFWRLLPDKRALLAGVAGPAADEMRSTGGFVRPDSTMPSTTRLEAGEIVMGRVGPDLSPPAGLEYPPDNVAAVAPVMYDGALLGTISVLRLHGPAFDKDELTLLNGIAGQAALALCAQRLYADAEAGFLATIESLVQALEASDPATSGHAQAVVELAEQVARRLGLEGADVRDVGYAAALHDVGKIGIPAEVLHKTGPLDAAERAAMRRHPEIGARILEPIPRMQRVAKIVRASHERVDGTGYPDGLHGRDIPQEARIIAVCDAYHAMIAGRLYRPGLNEDQAVAELRRHVGTQFDPEVVEAFVEVLSEHAQPEFAA